MEVPEKIFLSAAVLLLCVWGVFVILAVSLVILFVNDPRVILP